MKIECIKEYIVEAVGKAEKIASKNTSLPVLSGIYLDAKKNSLSIKSTNLDLGISITIPVKVSEPGEVVVPASIFYSLLSSLPDDRSITMTLKDQVLEVETKATKTSINTLPKDDYPLMGEITDDNAFSMPARDLVFGLKSVLYASSVGSVKPELSSVLIKYEEGSLIFAATDSFRLAEKKIRIKKVPHFKQILIPHKNAAEIGRLFDKGSEEISISIEEHKIALRTESIYLTSRIIEGNFPDYRQIIPKEHSTKAVILKQDLLNSLKTSLIFSDTSNQMTINVKPNKKEFEIKSKNNNVGESNNHLDAALEGEDISINVNYRYFTDCFSSIPTDSVSVSFSGESRPILIEPVGDTSFIYIVMPMNK